MSEHDLATVDGQESLIRAVREEEFTRFCDLVRQLITQTDDAWVRDELTCALDRMISKGDSPLAPR